MGQFYIIMIFSSIVNPYIYDSKYNILLCKSNTFHNIAYLVRLTGVFSVVSGTEGMAWDS
jgi:hypothetical protein